MSSPTETTTFSTKKLSLKLLIDKNTDRVLFAEANNDVVDFLLGLLLLPLGSITRLLNNDEQGHQLVGSIGNIYTSFKALDDAYIIEPSQYRNTLLNPKSAYTPACLLLDTNSASVAEQTKKYYRCSGTYYVSGYSNPRNCVSANFTETIGTKCPACGKEMTTEMKIVGESPKSDGGSGAGYVKELVTYMVMDDLSMKPLSGISAITLINKFAIKDVSSLYEATVEIGMKEGLELLKASLESTTALTTTFLGKSKGGVKIETAP